MQQPIGNLNGGANFLKELHRRFDDLRPIDGTRHGEIHLFSMTEDSQPGVRPSRADRKRCYNYDGPFAIVNRNDKNLTIHVHGKNITVSIDRVEPAYLLSESLKDTCEITSN